MLVGIFDSPERGLKRQIRDEKQRDDNAERSEVDVSGVRD